MTATPNEPQPMGMADIVAVVWIECIDRREAKKAEES